MNLLFINQYGPEDPSPTGRLLRDLINHFTAAGHNVRVVSAANDYRQRVPRGVKRWLRELTGLLKLLFNALIAQPRPDAVISFSSPPGLIVVATIAAWRHRASSIHWALDLYPDLALALGELRPGPLARFITATVHWAYHRTDQVVTLDADMQERLLQIWGVNSEIIPPWPPFSKPTDISPRAVSESKRAAPFWLYSGNLGRAHEWKTMLQIQAEIEKHDPRIELVIRGGGAAWPEARAWAERQQLQHCRWKDYIDETRLVESLLEAGVNVVTQRLEVRGMLWPSKLAVLLELPRPIMWVGPMPSDAARAVSQHPQSAAFTPGDSARAAAWLIETLGSTKSNPPSRSFYFESNHTCLLKKWEQVIELALKKRV